MRSTPLLVLLAAVSSALAQPLTCPQVTNISGRPCEVYHFHVQMYRPDTRGFADLIGINRFASQAACDRAREAQMARNLAVVETMKRVANDQQYQPDHFGPCHCDMTVEKTSPNFLTDLQRVAQVRLAEEVRGRVRERLLDRDLTSDSDVVRGLNPAPGFNALLGGPRLLPLPPAQVAAAAAYSPDDLKATKSVENLSTAPSSIDLPLVDVSSSEPVAVAVAPPSAPAPVAADVTAAPVPASAPAPAPAEVKAEQSAPMPTAEESADAFISVETQRIQNVLTASGTMTDEAVKSKILQSCMQRIQLLSNLRTLIQGSGARSRLATEARSAHAETERLALVARLFGRDMPPHWAPKDAADVILPPMPDVDSDPEKVLRDSGNRFSGQQKRRALYMLLAQTQPTEDQQLWLSTVVDTFLQ